MPVTLGSLLTDPQTMGWMNLGLYAIIFAGIGTALGRVVAGAKGGDAKNYSSLFGIIGLIVGMMFSLAMPPIHIFAGQIMPGLFAFFVIIIGFGFYHGIRGVSGGNTMLAVVIAVALAGGLWTTVSDAVGHLKGGVWISSFMGPVMGLALIGVMFWWFNTIWQESSAAGGIGNALSMGSSGRKLRDEVSDALPRDARAGAIAHQAQNAFKRHRQAGKEEDEARKAALADVAKAWGVDIPVAGAEPKATGKTPGAKAAADSKAASGDAKSALDKIKALKKKRKGAP